MEISIKRKFQGGVMDVKIDEKEDKEAIAKATFFMKPDYCGKCKKTNIIWESNKAKTDDGTFTYIKRKCLNCGATSTAGEYKEGGFFWKNWEIYEGNKKGPKDDVGDVDGIDVGDVDVTEF